MNKLIFTAAAALVVGSSVGGCASSTLRYTDPSPVLVTARAPRRAPAPAPAPVARIAVSETIYFDNGSARIKRESFGTVDEVAQVIQDHPEITLIRVEGHTDRAGNSRFNLSLSQRRAEAVRQRLISAGIAPDRLEAQGFGDQQPVAENDTRSGRTQNRRVDFVIVNRFEQEG